MSIPTITLPSNFILPSVPSVVSSAAAKTTSVASLMTGASTAHIAGKCTDLACTISINEAHGFNPAAASFIATGTFPSDIYQYFSDGKASTLPTVIAAATDPAGIISQFKSVFGELPTSLQAEVTPYIAQLESLQNGDASTSSGATSVSSHAAAARPTDVALMAMAGVVAGVAGLAVGL